MFHGSWIITTAAWRERQSHNSPAIVRREAPGEQERRTAPEEPHANTLTTSTCMWACQTAGIHWPPRQLSWRCKMKRNGNVFRTQARDRIMKATHTGTHTHWKVKGSVGCKFSHDTALCTGCSKSYCISVSPVLLINIYHTAHFVLPLPGTSWGHKRIKCKALTVSLSCFYHVNCFSGQFGGIRCFLNAAKWCSQYFMWIIISTSSKVEWSSVFPAPAGRYFQLRRGLIKPLCPTFWAQNGR